MPQLGRRIGRPTQRRQVGEVHVTVPTSRTPRAPPPARDEPADGLNDDQPKDEGIAQAHRLLHRCRSVRTAVAQEMRLAVEGDRGRIEAAEIEPLPCDRERRRNRAVAGTAPFPAPSSRTMTSQPPAVVGPTSAPCSASSPARTYAAATVGDVTRMYDIGGFLPSSRADRKDAAGHSRTAYARTSGEEPLPGFARQEPYRKDTPMRSF
jgi:hypothetical protein